ncbi:MAG TPA: MmgE/PrpD family protein [Syntrophorhabdaceae bacterium]|nr:MmgE/PrpD family protein [Syntrophorhabdaceae bacterium]
MSVVAELIRNVLETPFERFAPDEVDRARVKLIDVIGCIIGGANAPGCSMLIDLVREWGGLQEGMILAHGIKVPMHNAALVNSVMARSYDFEPTGPLVDGKSTPAHLSGTTVPTAITVADQKNASGKDLLTALIVGDDIASRIIAASNLDVDSGFDSTGTANAFGAAAIAGRLLGLNEQQMLNAFGIVLNQFAGTFQNIFDAAHTFKLPQGLASQAGVFSVKLAQKGFTGVRDPLLSKYGYFALYCKSYQLDMLTKNLGKQYYMDNTCKPYPCCRSNHAAIESVLKILESHAVSAEAIDEIIVDITPRARDFAVGQPFKIREVPQIDAAFSIQYNVANALLRRGTKLEHFTEENILDNRIADLVRKIRLTATTPPETPLGAGVTVKMKNGDEYHARVDMPRGHGVLTPLSYEEKKAKFFDNVRFSSMVPVSKAEEAVELLEHIEEVDNVSAIFRLLVA